MMTFTISMFLTIKLWLGAFFSRHFMVSLLLCTCLPFPNYAQTSLPAADARWREAGLPFIQAYSASEYGGGEQNWDIVQDKRGVMYFANNAGLLEYDGASWRQTYFASGMTSQTLTKGASGRIWLGGHREFGYMAPDSQGYLQYISLFDHVPARDREVEVDWRVETTSRCTYFHGQNVLIRWTGQSDKKKVWRFVKGIGSSFVVDDEFYLRQVGTGLLKVEDDSLRFIPGSEKFADISVSVFLPYINSKQLSNKSAGETANREPENSSHPGHKQSLIATRKHGLFVYDGFSFYPFKTEADAFLVKNIIECGVVLADGSIALGTRYGGLAIINQRGSLQRILNKATGLPDNAVYQVYEDTQKGLWLALNMGLARVELSSQFTQHSQSPGLKSSVENIVRHSGKIYASSASGVYFMDHELISGALPVFKPVAGINAQCRGMISADSLLLVISNEGVYQIKNDQAELIKNDELGRPTFFIRSEYTANLIYVVSKNGLGLLQLRSGKWIYIRTIPGIHEQIEWMIESSPDTLWLTTRYGSALRLTIQSLQPSAPQVRIERFGKAHGLAEGWIRTAMVDGRIVFTTDKGLRYFDPVSREFIIDSSFAPLFADTTWNFGGGFFCHADQGRILTKGAGLIGFATPGPNGTYSWENTPFLRTAELDGIWCYYVDKKHQGIFWFGGSTGIARYDETVKKNYDATYPALIRRVTVNGDSMIYGGGYANPDSLMQAPTLDFESNTISIEYAAPYYDNEAANQFQFFLDGLDDGWSDWISDTKITYRKLPEGGYRARVRARNVYQRVSGESAFAFEILPPWYRTWWSYALYGLMVFGALYSIRRYENNRRQHKHRAELQHVETKKLKELDKLKSDFFANISHEFRTPLTLILGPAEQLLEKNSGDDKRKLSLIRRNAQHLLRLINQLLDVSKLEGGKMQLQTSAGDFIPFLKGLVMSFESLAQQKGIDLLFEVNDAPQPCEGSEPSQGLDETYFDRDKIEKIFTNLLSNAFKFTPEGGSVRVTATLISDCRLRVSCPDEDQIYEILHPRCAACINSADASGGQDSPQSVNCVEITVADTGVGIPSEQLPYIFDRFYQVDASSRRANGGTGIGLALVNELVEMHNGSIVVNSRDGGGAAFTVCLPLGKKHLKVDEMVDTSLSPTVTEEIGEGADVPIVVVSEDKEDALRAGEVRPLNEDTQAPTTDDPPIILIIEDNADVRAYIREQLQTEYAILEAEDGEAGIAWAIEAIPDLVISDVMMPKKDGFEVCRTLKTDARTSHIPVILLTAKALEREKLTGLETGADAYVLKPFRQKELAVRVRTLIEQRRKLRQRFSTVTVIKPSEVEATSMDRAFLARVIEVIEARFDDESFNVEALTSEMAMSASQLNRKLNALIGQPAGQMIRSMRLQRAADLLARKSGNVAEICYAVGFSDQANFTRSFKKQFGCSPSDYQKTN